MKRVPKDFYKNLYFEEDDQNIVVEEIAIPLREYTIDTSKAFPIGVMVRKEDFPLKCNGCWGVGEKNEKGEEVEPFLRRKEIREQHMKFLSKLREAGADDMSYLNNGFCTLKRII